MSRVTQSISQLLTTFGPGAMMDLPTRAVVVSGLDHWDGMDSDRHTRAELRPKWWRG
jgi:hypothetical protein